LKLVRYIIVRMATLEFKSVYSARTMPALYVTYGAAKGELKKQQKAGCYMGYEVREVELTVR